MVQTAAAATRARAASYYDLPNEATTLDGVRYDPRENLWSISTISMTKQFDFRDLKGRSLSSTLATSFKGVVLSRLQSHSLASSHTFYTDLRDLLRYVIGRYPGATEVTMAHLAAYRATLPKERLWKSTVIHMWIMYWSNIGLPCIADDALAYAEDVERHYAKTGQAVRTRCPIHGPYTSLEYDGLYKALHATFARGEVTLYNYVLCLLSGAIAPRPSQLALLKVSDLKIILHQNNAEKMYVLAVPRVKQRGQKIRAELTERDLIEEIGMVLEAHVGRIRAGAKAAGVDPEHAPMFPPTLRGQQTFAHGQHTSPINIGRRIAATLEALNVRSERTGETINATATRARRTLGTRMGQEGKPPAVIADALDHNDTQSVMIYVEARIEMLGRLEEKLAMHLAPLAQRFLGKIARRGTDAENGIQRHVFGIAQNGAAPEDIGGCGKHSFCGLYKPLACYTCIQFRPWVDGPHEAVLEGLLAKREKQAERDVRVAESLDDTILAAASVVQQCREKKRALESSANV